MRIYHDADADLGLLHDRRIAVIGYGNQGRAQALNLRDSGLEVIVGNRQDEWAARASEDGFPVQPIAQAAGQGSVVMLLIPDEVMPAVFGTAIAPHLNPGAALVFASGYTIAYNLLTPPPGVDVVLVAPRMIGAGVRDLYLAGEGFPAFFGVAQDATGQARALALALARGIGATRMGAVEVTFAQEAELDLFTEQCFGPAFGQVLLAGVNLLLDEGYPAEAVLLELYMSGEFAYTLGKIAELGTVEQTALHSRTSQYGSLSRGMRFLLPELRTKMAAGLEEIRSGAFAREWTAEQAAGTPTLEALRDAARSLPLHQLEQQLRAALRGRPGYIPAAADAGNAPGSLPLPALRERVGGAMEGPAWALHRLRQRLVRKPVTPHASPLDADQIEPVLHAFLTEATRDPALCAFAAGRAMTIHYVVDGAGIEFHMGFRDGAVCGELSPPPVLAELRLTATASLLDGILTGRLNPMRVALTGELAFEGDARQAMALQRIQPDLVRLYRRARGQVAGHRP